MTEEISLPEFARNTINLASPRLGSEVTYATDDFFADKSRMVKDEPAVFVADKYDDHGKWMDGWESRRRRDGGQDHCIVKLGVRGFISGVDIDTSHFTGNFPPAASIEACVSDSEPNDQTVWSEIVAPTTLGGNAHHFVAVTDQRAFNYLRVHMLPDGGIARLRVYGSPDAVDVGEDEVFELSAVKSGGRVIAFNDSHYGDPWVILTEGRGQDMGDGWETRRRREPGNDWIIVKLGVAGIVERIEVDTAHFKGNFPDRCSIEGAYVESATDQSIVTQAMFWNELLPQHKLQMDHRHFYEGEVIKNIGKVNYVKLNIFPDGGISRLRLFGKKA
jgi:allantoicase